MSRISRRAVMLGAVSAFAVPALPKKQPHPRAAAFRRMIAMADDMIARAQTRPDNAFSLKIANDIRTYFVQQIES